MKKGPGKEKGPGRGEETWKEEEIWKREKAHGDARWNFLVGPCEAWKLQPDVWTCGIREPKWRRLGDWIGSSSYLAQGIVYDFGTLSNRVKIAQDCGMNRYSSTNHQNFRHISLIVA